MVCMRLCFYYHVFILQILCSDFILLLTYVAILVIWIIYMLKHKGVLIIMLIFCMRLCFLYLLYKF